MPSRGRNSRSGVEGGDSALLFCSLRFFLEYNVQLWGPQLKKDLVLLKQVVGHKDDHSSGALLRRQTESIRVVQSGEEMSLGRP